MDLTLPTSWMQLSWLAASAVLACLAGQLCWAWLELAPGGSLITRAARCAGGGASLAAGWWAVHALCASIWPLNIEVGFHLQAELALAGLAAAACSALLWGLGESTGRKRARIEHWGQQAAALATVCVAWQMLGVLAAGWRPGVDWSFGHVALAWLCSATGCLLGFALFHGLHRRDRRAFAWHRMLSGWLVGGSFVASQALVWSGAGLRRQMVSDYAHPLSAGVLSMGGLFGGAALLALLQVTLAHRVRARSARAHARRELAKHSLHDPVTGLPGPQLFDGTLAQAVARADSDDEPLALLFINLDGMKSINLAVGHEGGDRVLREVAQRLRALSKPHLSARLAGDEFLALVTEDTAQHALSAHAARLISSISQPYTVAGRTLSLSCSIGVAIYPDHGGMSKLINHAQLAMTTAKAAGGASHAFFEHSMMRTQRDDVELSRDLRHALQRGQIELYYQPKIHAPSGEITGCEALMRWHHPQRGMVSPGIFIPIAERYGLINALGQWVIEEACRQIHAWREQGLRMRVAVNLSVHQLRQADLVQRIGEALARHRVQPDLITCEVTESTAMDDAEITGRVLSQLKRLGVHISIDDFGTGHSSLSYLRKLPADELKIDRSFVMDLETSDEARKVALAVINLAKALELQVVAEGVETEGQNGILREYGCDQLQGYLFAKPMSATALALWAVHDEGPRTLNFRASLFKETRPAAVN